MKKNRNTSNNVSTEELTNKVGEVSKVNEETTKTLLWKKKIKAREEEAVSNVESKILELESVISNKDEIINNIFTKIDKLDNLIDWSTCTPKEKIKMLFLFTKNNWTDVIEIIALLINLKTRYLAKSKR